MKAQEAAWLADPDETPFPGPLAAQRRLVRRARLPLRGVRLSTGDVCLLLALILRVDSKTGETSPRWNVSVPALALDTRMTDRGVRLALAHLEAAGVVVRVPRERRGQQQTNSYRVIVPHPDEDWWDEDPRR